MTSAAHARRRSLDWDLLFLTPTKSRISRSTIVVGYAGAFLLIGAVALFRQSGTAAINTVWAEDGAVYYTEALSHSVLNTIFTPYGGYFQLFQRLAIQVTRLFPVGDAATVITITGAVSLSLLCLFVFHASRGTIQTVPGRLLLVAAMALLPLATAELLDNLVNLPWWLFFATFWALIWRPRTIAGALLAGVICMLATGSDPLVGLLLPVALLRVWSLRRTDRQSSVIGFALGLGYQAVALATADGQGPVATASTHGLLSSLGIRVGLGWVTGNRLTNPLIASQNVLWSILGFAVLIGVVVIGFMVRSQRVRLFVALTVSLAVLIYVVPVTLRGAVAIMAVSPVPFGSRYDATPILLIISALLVEAEYIYASGRWRARYAGFVVLTLLLIPAWVVDFDTANARSGGPLWRDQVAAAEIVCTSGHHEAVPVKSSPAGQYVVVPCSYLVTPTP